MADEDLRPPPPPPVPEMVEFIALYPAAEQQRTQLVTPDNMRNFGVFAAPWRAHMDGVEMRRRAEADAAKRKAAGQEKT
jgi:hypothetical protein